MEAMWKGPFMQVEGWHLAQIIAVMDMSAETGNDHLRVGIVKKASKDAR